MNKNQLSAEIEAIIFAAGSPVPTGRIAEALEINENEINSAIDDLVSKYSNDDHGIQIIRLGKNVQMCSKKQHGDAIRKVMDLKRNTPLSQAAFEVLAVIAYNQPVTKAFVEQVRGVDCSGVIGSLCSKGLVEEKGRLELPGRPLIYGTTDNFMRCFGISSYEELPTPDSHREIAENEIEAENDEN